MRWYGILALLVACGSNGNDYYDVEVCNPCSDVHAIVADVWHCVAMTGAEEGKVYPCYETTAECEENRAMAITSKYTVGRCEQHKSAFCVEGTRSGRVAKKCSLTRQYCEARRQRGADVGFEVGPCKPSNSP